MEQEFFHWKRPGTIAEAYFEHTGGIAGRFDYLPWDPPSWAERSAWLDESEESRAARGKTAEVLRNFNRAAGSGEAVMRRIGQLADGRALAVVGGQQAGLFTGPLYVIYKAWSLIQSAANAERRLGRPVVPVFWIAGEDHDFEEINHTYFLTPNLDIEKVRIAHPSGGRRISASMLKLPAHAWEDALRRLDGLLPDTAFKPDLMSKMHEILKHSDTLVDQFARIMAWLFGRYGLVLLDSDDPEWRALQSPMLAAFARLSKELAAALEEGEAAIRQMGYEPQAEVRSDGMNLFYNVNSERTLLFRTAEGGARDKTGRLQIGRDQLQADIMRHPERFSNNVLTRPIMQEYLLPVLGTVLGRGEIAYWAQLQSAFHLFHFRMPLILPRTEATLIDPAVRKHMNKFGLTFGEAATGFDAKRQSFLDNLDAVGIKPSFAEAKKMVNQIYEPLVDTVVRTDPGLRKLAETNRHKVLEQVEFLERRAAAAFQAQHEAELRRWQQIRLNILPLDKPQDRVFNVLAYLNQYGEDWLEELLGTAADAGGNHSILYL